MTFLAVRELIYYKNLEQTRIISFLGEDVPTDCDLLKITDYSDWRCTEKKVAIEQNYSIVETSKFG